MNPVVVDSSAMLACLIPDESPPASVLAALRGAVFVVPGHWPTEVGNGLRMAHRRSRITSDTLELIGDELLKQQIEVEATPLEVVMRAVFPLAEQHGLTIYDAAYLELAQRRRLTLATLDGDLRKAAKKARVKLL